MWRAKTIGALLLVTVLASSAAAQKRVFLTKEKALERALQKADRVTERRVTISAEEAETFAKELGMAILDSTYVFHEAIEADAVVRRAVIMNTIGQYQPITFIVALLPEGTVERVEIMVYREARGSEVRRRAFLKQFEKKSLEDRLQLHKDIMNVTGATISSRSVADGVKLALLVHERLIEEEMKAEQTSDD